MKQSVLYIFITIFAGLMLAAIYISSVSNLIFSSQNVNRILIEDIQSLDIIAFDKPSPMPAPELLSDYYTTYGQDDTGLLCLNLITGTVRSEYTISSPGGISGFSNHQSANFSQRIISQSSTKLVIEVTTQRYLDTRAPYPVVAGAIPSEIKPYLLPEPGFIQSDDPQIIAKAQELVSGVNKQAKAVDAILAWVRGNIRYESGSPNDALSVFTNKAGVCAGFSSLTAALLRAAGIPAEYHEGCVFEWGEDDYYGWQVGKEGSWHAWNRVYYPDVGWVALDPQVTTNYLDASHVITGFDQCGEYETVVERTNHQTVNDSKLYDLRTAYTNSYRSSLLVPYIPTWDRHPLKVYPSSPSVMLPISNTNGKLYLEVENLSCYVQKWQIKTEAPWLSPNVLTGDTAGTAIFDVNANGMDMGFYTSTITVYGAALFPPDEWSISRTFTVNLRIVEDVFNTYLPILAMNHR